MPDVRNCRRCGKVYNYIGGAPLCSACREQDEQDYKKVKEYLYKYPGATMSEVSTELEVAVEKIKRFLKEGRLEIIGDSGNLVLECENCGKAIKTGRFCAECEKEMLRNFKNTAMDLNIKYEEEEKPKGNSYGMRYLNRDEK